MLSDDLIRKKLDSLHEHTMAKDIFVPLLKKMAGVKGVKFTGGDTEQGIDVEYYELAAPDKKRKYAGIQFKKGNLKYGAGGNKNTVKEIKNQAEEAFEKDLHAIDNDSTHKLSRFICNRRALSSQKQREKRADRLIFGTGHILPSSFATIS